MNGLCGADCLANCWHGDFGYGAFHGGDPRLFQPDPECSTDVEREAHRLACEAWERDERPTVPVSGFEHSGEDFTYTDKRTGKIETIPAGTWMHVLRSAFGLGGYEICCGHAATCPIRQEAPHA